MRTINVVSIKWMLLFTVLFFAIPYSHAQEKLSPEEAVAIALRSNFDILLAKNDMEIAKASNFTAATGMLPLLTFNGSNSYSRNNIYQELSSGVIINRSNVPVSNLNLGLGATWTIFDGLKMFVLKDKLKTLQEQSETQLKERIQNTIAAVLAQYYQIVLQKQQLKAIQDLIQVYNERVFLSDKKFEVGYSDKSPLLQAQVDLGSQKTNQLRTEANLRQAKAMLNQLLSRQASEDFDVQDTIILNPLPDWSALLQSTQANLSSAIAQQDLALSKLQVKELHAQRYPSLALGGGYLLNQNNSKAGFIVSNRAYGPQLGLNMALPIYGTGLKKQIEVNKKVVVSKEILIEQVQQNNETLLYLAYQNYLVGKESLQLQKNNVQVAEENMNLAFAKFKLNQATTVELKTAQNSFEQALYEMNATRCATKLAEIELLRLANMLIRQPL